MTRSRGRVEGLEPACCRLPPKCPQRDSNPCDGLERAATWTASRWGPAKPGYRYMNQREVAPQAQSLCFAVHCRQSQYSHQIHLRWFSSSTKRATIQRRISVRDTPSTYRYGGEHGNGPGGPIRVPAGPSRSEYGVERPPQ